MAFILLSVLWVVIYRFINPPVTGMMLHKWISEDTYQFDFEWKSLEEISKSLPLAFIASEDQSFMQHSGIDIEAMKEAWNQNRNSKVQRGASTISQQVAKNVFLFPSKNLIRKGVEAYFTFLIEFFWGKCRIMEVYLNVVELGDGVYGVELASNQYFGVSAKQITSYQAALMATALPNPIRYKLVKPGNYMLKRRGWVLRQMNNLGGEVVFEDCY